MRRNTQSTAVPYSGVTYMKPLRAGANVPHLGEGQCAKACFCIEANTKYGNERSNCSDVM